MEKIRAKRNRTIMLSEDERIELRKELSMLSDKFSVDDFLTKRLIKIYLMLLIFFQTI